MTNLTPQRRAALWQWVEADGTKPHLAPRLADIVTLLHASEELDARAAVMGRCACACYANPDDEPLVRLSKLDGDADASV